MKNSILYIYVLLVVVFLPTARAQEPVVVVDSTTQFEVPTLLKPWDPVLVDHAFGLRGGLGTGFMRREPATQTTAVPFLLYNFGISYRFDVPAQKYVGTIIFELQYVQKAFAYNLTYDEPEAYGRRFDVIELPILWQPYFPLGRRGSRVYLTAGPFLSYTISSKEFFFNSTTKEITSLEPYEMHTTEDFYWNYGIAAGVGFYVAVGERMALSIDGRYTIQLSDITRGPEYVAGNPFRTPVDHVGISLGLHYTFWKNSNKNGK